jgi:histone-lysine N-methyltransferase SETD3
VPFDRRRKIEAEYEELKGTVFMRNPSVFPLDKFTFDLFLWAFVMLFSRAARLTSKTTGEELALVPYADLMNHNPYSNTYIDAQRSGMPLISKMEEVAIYADRSYKKFEQVRFNIITKTGLEEPSEARLLNRLLHMKIFISSIE